MKIRKATPADFATIARLMNALNQLEDRQCLHSSLGDKADDLLLEMEKWHAEGEILFVLAESNDQVTGVIGSEFDEELGRGWVWGPHCTVASWQDNAHQLFAALRQALPDTIHQFDAYLNIHNQRGLDFYKGMGFAQDQLAHVYAAALSQTITPIADPCPPLEPTWHASFSELQKTIFPNAYYSAERVIKDLDEQRQVFVYPQGAEALGYVYASVWPDKQNGEVEFLGVRRDARRQGIGRKLLLTALDWLFIQHKVVSIQLTVNDEQATARALYESVGFKLLYSGVGMRRLYE